MSFKVEPWDEKKNSKLNEHNCKRKIEKLGYVVSTENLKSGHKVTDQKNAKDIKIGIPQGKYQIEINGETHVLKLGDTATIPANTPYSAEVVSKEEVVLLTGTK
eukprot:TRINITY_DN3889_c0_g1_i1.p1 TRINITY_DN3889_c0_g1~~TRINITY_DN3889_c0_g1_i1.p1  ORF type:complete len:104 (+),score=22.94 TRINITY_DN3889_c0_g1_i1:108-419(+)